MRRDVLEVESTEDDRPERRIAACPSACQGIPTGPLEQGAILRLIVACIYVRDERVREALNDLSALRLRLEGLDSKAGPAASEPRHGGPA